MRALYLLMGMLLGMWYTTNVALTVYSVMEWSWDKEFLTASLTGYYEGWDRGRFHTTQKLYWIVMDTQAELEMCEQREKARHK